MFQQSRFIQNSFSIFFPRQLTIRRQSNDFEDILKGQYFQPQIISVPDEMNPEIPRIIFGSEHGFSQIVISQINISLNVSYSPDWQLDINLGKEYLMEKVPLLFSLVETIGDPEVYFCGLSTKARLASQSDSHSILEHIARLFLSNEEQSNSHDLQIKKTVTHDDRFFSTQSVGNYRVWKIPENPDFILHLSNNQVIEQGIEIIGDYNDRYGYNQHPDYKSGLNVANDIVTNGITEAIRLAAIVKE